MSANNLFRRSASNAAFLWKQIFYGLLLAGICLLMVLISINFDPGAIWVAFFSCNAAAILIFSAGVWSAHGISAWRRDSVGLEAVAPPKFAQHVLAIITSPWQRPSPPISPAPGSSESGDVETASIIASFPILPFVALVVLASLTAWAGMTWSAPVPPIGTTAYVFAGMALIVAYFYLVVERDLAGADPSVWPEAPQLSQLARLPIASLVVSSIALLLNARESPYSIRLLAMLGCFQLFIAGELLLRAGASLFSPQSKDREPSFLGKSLVGDLIHWPPRPLAGIQAQLKDGLGIDLQQIWAFSFIRGAAPIVVLVCALFAWCFSGLVEIPLTQRGIYERFGRPEAVLPPGLHLGLPWPFGRVIMIENGVVHEIATSASVDPSSSPSDAEGPAPESANRLWDGTHISEKSQIIASRSQGRESFQLVNMDVRFVYRIGLSDRAALQAAYQVTDLDALIENIANRILVHDFSTRTLDDVLSATRQDLSRTISAKVQAEMDSLDSGVEILAVVIEAIHPPAGAADAYHAVQAAQISVETEISLERGAAAAVVNQAISNATSETDSATAAAGEGISRAQVTLSRFDAEKSAYDVAGQAFLTEEYFRQLTTGIARANVLIIDHRIDGAGSPTLDLRDPLSKPAGSEITGAPFTLHHSEDSDP